jgi:YVTN family beta-propeller protein
LSSTERVRWSVNGSCLERRSKRARADRDPPTDLWESICLLHPINGVPIMKCALGLAFSVVLSSAYPAPTVAGAPTAPSDLSLGSLSATTTSLPPVGTVYTANEDDGSVSVIDLASGTVSTIGTEIAPHNLQASFDGRLVLVVGPKAEKDGSHGHESERGALLIFASDRFADGPVATIEVGRHPAHVITDGETRLAFVTNSEDDSVAVIDIARRTSIGSIGTGRFPHGLRLSPNGGEIYVANVKDGSVSVIDAIALREVARIPVGRAPVQVGFTPDGQRVHVSLRDENSVAVIDTSTRQVIAKVPVGRGPIQVYATPDGTSVYVANQGSAEQPDSTVSVIDTASNRVSATIETGRGAHGVVVSPDGQQVYVTNILDDSVSVIDVAARRVVRDFPVGEGPNGVTFRAAVD